MNGKVIVIVGATGGICSTLTHELAETGANLILAARDSARLSALVSQLSVTEKVLPIATDITQPEQVQTLMEKTIAQFGQIDVLVNAAGAGILKPHQKIEPTDLDTMLDLNLKGSFYTSQAAAEVMRKQKSGHICNVVGILGKHPMAMGSAYCASKFGAVGFSKCLAEELKRYGVKVTLFYFGGVNTPFWDQAGLKVDRAKMLSPDTAAQGILFALQAEPNAVPTEINIQPDNHLFF